MEITEKEYRRVVDATISDLSIRIRGCGLSIGKIANMTKLSYQTIFRAAHFRPIRFDAAVRIDYLLSALQREQNKR